MLVVADPEVNAPNTDHPPNKKCLGHQPKRLNFLAPRPGLEPGTYGITTSVPAVKPHR